MMSMSSNLAFGPGSDQTGLTFAKRLKWCLSETLTELNPRPIGVVMVRKVASDARSEQAFLVG